MAADNSPLLLRKRVLAAKAETTTGTAEALVAGDGAWIVYNPVLRPIVPVIEREALSSMETLTGVSGAREGELKFSMDLVGNGGVGQPLWATTLLPGCGMSNSSGTFSFVSGPATLTTLTMALYEMGRVRKLTGAAGTWDIPLKAGEPARINFTFRGLYADDADAAILAPTYPTVLPPRWANTSALSWGAYAPVVSELTVAANNEVVMREDANKTEGYRSAIIVDRKPGGAFQPEAALVATQDWHTILKNSTESALAIVLGTVANNIITINAPKAQVVERDTDQRNKIITDPINWRANRNASTLDSAMTMVFT